MGANIFNQVLVSSIIIIIVGSLGGLLALYLLN